MRRTAPGEDAIASRPRSAPVNGTRAICPRSIPDADINTIRARPHVKTRAATHDPIALLARDLTHPDRLGRRLPLFKTQVCEKEPLHITTLPTLITRRRFADAVLVPREQTFSGAGIGHGAGR